MIPHVLVPDIVLAINASRALRVVVLNLSPEPGETQGFSAERHIQVLSQHAPGLSIDRIVVDSNSPLSDSERAYLQRAAQGLGARAVFADVAIAHTLGRELAAKSAQHDPVKLGRVLSKLYAVGR